MAIIDHLKDHHIKGRKFESISAITIHDTSLENVDYFAYPGARFGPSLMAITFGQIERASGV